MTVRGRETSKAAHMMMRETKGPWKLALGSQERKTIQARRVQSTKAYLLSYYLLG